MSRTGLTGIRTWLALVLAVSLLGCSKSKKDSRSSAEKVESSAPASTAAAKRPWETAVTPPAEAASVGTGDARATPGYTLLAPLSSNSTYLVDLAGKVVHKWEGDCRPGQAAYLLENGHLLRAGMVLPPKKDHESPPAPGAGGKVQEYTWDGELVWDYPITDDIHTPHHDIEGMPNGNVLLIVSESKTLEEALAAGRDPALLRGSKLRADCIIEVKPTGKTTGEIVWEWHAWDHMVQDRYADKANYGDVASRPELVDFNYAEELVDRLSSKEANKLASLGYLDSSSTSQPKHSSPFWTHINSVDYNAELDQIMLSALGFNEVWIIDHSTTTEEAAGHTGGRGGKGGDLLYRWGNPRTYYAGSVRDQELFAQHDASWISAGLPGAGNMLVFNNGLHRPGGNHSSVEEVVLPVNSEGHYVREGKDAYGPKEPVWSYTAPEPSDFYSMYVSGAQRLSSGNTLICAGQTATVFEVTPDKEVVWRYLCPVPNTARFGGASSSRSRSRGQSPRELEDAAARSGPPDRNDERTRSRPGDSSDRVRPGGKEETVRYPGVSGSRSGRTGRGSDGPPSAGPGAPSDASRRPGGEAKGSRGPGDAGREGGPESGPPRTEDVEQLFVAMDSDEDGEVSAAEISDAMLAVLRADRNRDGKLSPDELPAMRPGRRERDEPMDRDGGHARPDSDEGEMVSALDGASYLASIGKDASPIFRANRYASDYPGLAGKDLTPGESILELVRAAGIGTGTDSHRRGGRRRPGDRSGGDGSSALDRLIKRQREQP